MFSKARTLDPVSKSLVDAFFAAGGQVTICPPRRAHQRSAGGWALVNDQSRQQLGRAVG